MRQALIRGHKNALQLGPDCMKIEVLAAPERIINASIERLQFFKKVRCSSLARYGVGTGQCLPPPQFIDEPPINRSPRQLSAKTDTGHEFHCRIAALAYSDVAKQPKPRDNRQMTASSSIGTGASNSARRGPRPFRSIE
jgi:hypothetical protein